MSRLSEDLLAWQIRFGRHNLPWQGPPRSAYRIWIAEVMLQQTQVATVIPYFERFLAKWPTLSDLALSDEDSVLAQWSGLGYYRRARYLHAAAKICLDQFDGELPRDFDALAALPGIGRSTAGAILAQAWDLPFAILDGNVKRVLTRYHGIGQWPGSGPVTRRLWQLAEEHTPSQHAGLYAQAIMDLGATVCTPQHPRCTICPIALHCSAHRQGRETQWPVRAPRKSMPVRQIHWLLLREATGRLLFRQRSADGLWPRLWSLPEAPSAPDQHAALLVDFNEADRQALPPLRHAFTHFTLDVHPVLFHNVRPRAACADPMMAWHSPSCATELALPAPVRRLLTHLPEMPR